MKENGLSEGVSGSRERSGRFENDTIRFDHMTDSPRGTDCSGGGLHGCRPGAAARGRTRSSRGVRDRNSGRAEDRRLAERRALGAGSVRRDGKISVPLVDDVQAAGLTPHELKEVLTEALAEYVTAPDARDRPGDEQPYRHRGRGVLRSGQLPPRDMRVIEAIMTMVLGAWAKKDRIKAIRNMMIKP